jgi:hypothetical protein
MARQRRTRKDQTGPDQARSDRKTKRQGKAITRQTQIQANTAQHNTAEDKHHNREQDNTTAQHNTAQDRPPQQKAGQQHSTRQDTMIPDCQRVVPVGYVEIPGRELDLCLISLCLVAFCHCHCDCHCLVYSSLLPLRKIGFVVHYAPQRMGVVVSADATQPQKSAVNAFANTRSGSG